MSEETRETRPEDAVELIKGTTDELWLVRKASLDPALAFLTTQPYNQIAQRLEALATGVLCKFNVSQENKE